ncbi:MAG TPA: hypothetical protein VKG45_03750 [Actinomycetes bacterium]|nr:hypothetical protein [Actinomycetes bacterium]
MERQECRDDDMLTKVRLGAALNRVHADHRPVDSRGTGPPYIRLPRNRLRWRWGDVRAWLEARREAGGDPPAE